MKQPILLRSIFLYCSLVNCHLAYSQTIFVNKTANGATNGTSWQDAYTDLSSALANAPEKSTIWMAKGIYHPGESSPGINSVFFIQANISIYGGFAGHESSLEERDILINETILSGDLNGDDIQDDFTNNKTDNTHHVVFVDSLLNLVILDGLTIKGGHTSNLQNATLFERAGGGIYVTSPVVINGCQFQNNFGREGGGLFFTGGASGSVLEQSTFSNNRSAQRGAGVFALSTNDLTIKHNDFTNNQVNRGAVAASFTNQLMIDSCYFANNQNSTTNGGAIFSFQNRDMVIRHCQFERNSAVTGGAIVINGDQIPTDTLNNIRIQNCTFSENKSTGSAGAVYVLSNPQTYFKECTFSADSSGIGGAMYIEQPQDNTTDTGALWIDQCVFKQCKAGNGSGGAIFMRFTAAKIENSTFENNWTAGLNDGGGAHIFINSKGKNIISRNNHFLSGTSEGYGGAILISGLELNGLFENCVFNQNRSENDGGAVHSIFGATTIYKQCVFRANESLGDSGGALGLAYDSTSVEVYHSLLVNNKAAIDGGAIHSGGGSGLIKIIASTLDSNIAIDGFGGALFINESGDDDISSLTIENSFFGFNQSNNQGGALNIVDTDTRITNCVFYKNVCTEFGIGAAMAIKTTDYDSLEATITNTTIARNHGSFSAGIALETQFTETSLTTVLQNCLFSNEGYSNFIVEGGNPVIISKGGNLSDDLSLMLLLTHPKDIHQVSPVFNNAAEHDYSLTSDSPGIDGGVTMDAPEFDIIGNPRVNTPDIGAYENQFPTGTNQTELTERQEIFIWPNPISDNHFQAILQNDCSGPIEVDLLDMNGRIVYRKIVFKNVGEQKFDFELPTLPAGLYRLNMRHAIFHVSMPILKI